jgi:hypothetical protein
LKRPSDGLAPFDRSKETGAQAPVFFRPHFDGHPYFTMWKIFLRRKKSCCKAQDRYCGMEKDVS